jgi:hypothetical protein
MAFTEATKLAVKRKAHFACCLCRSVGIELHHIIPQADGGPDTEDNAAPLCPSCHETYGANPTKRKFIREARDFWYEICATRYASDVSRIDALQQMLQVLPTKTDMEQLIARISGASTASDAASKGNSADDSLPPELADAEITPESLKTYLRYMYGCLAHCGSSNVGKPIHDVVSVGHTHIRTLHNVLSLTRGPLADVAQERRDAGENMDNRTDEFPVRLFLAVLDEPYCIAFYPNVHAKYVGRKNWIRSASNLAV